MKNSLAIPSNRGTERIEFTVSDSAPPVVTSMRFVQDATAWSGGREAVATGLEGFGEFLPQLAADAAQWMRDGNEAQASWTYGGARLGYHLGLLPDILITVGKAALRLEFKSFALSYEFAMVVDPSCLRIFTERAAAYAFGEPVWKGDRREGEGPGIDPDSAIPNQ